MNFQMELPPIIKLLILLATAACAAALLWPVWQEQVRGTLSRWLHRVVAASPRHGGLITH